MRIAGNYQALRFVVSTGIIQLDMKIRTEIACYNEMLRRLDKAKKEKHRSPVTPSPFLRKIAYIVSAHDVKKAHFTYETVDMEKLPADEPCLILMNHSSFIDLEIMQYVFKDRPFHIVCTSDGFVGKAGILRRIGCIPTKKFLTDTVLVKDMVYAINTLRNSILLYPEASYSFDGTATPLPKSIGRLIKLLKVPVVMVRTYGAFQRDPLYNNLQVRDVDVSAEVKLLFTGEYIQSADPAELQARVEEEFSFDNFEWQLENQVIVDEPFRADFLNRVLYKCPACMEEGYMSGKGTTLTCKKCGKVYPKILNIVTK